MSLPFNHLPFLGQFIRTVRGQWNFRKQNDLLTCSERFLTSNKLEQLEFKLEKILGFRNMQEKFKYMHLNLAKAAIVIV